MKPPKSYALQAVDVALVKAGFVARLRRLGQWCSSALVAGNPVVLATEVTRIQHKSQVTYHLSVSQSALANYLCSYKTNKTA